MTGCNLVSTDPPLTAMQNASVEQTEEDKKKKIARTHSFFPLFTGVCARLQIVIALSDTINRLVEGTSFLPSRWPLTVGITTTIYISVCITIFFI